MWARLIFVLGSLLTAFWPAPTFAQNMHSPMCAPLGCNFGTPGFGVPPPAAGPESTPSRSVAVAPPKQTGIAFRGAYLGQTHVELVGFLQGNGFENETAGLDGDRAAVFARRRNQICGRFYLSVEGDSYDSIDAALLMPALLYSLELGGGNSVGPGMAHYLTVRSMVLEPCYFDAEALDIEAFGRELLDHYSFVGQFLYAGPDKGYDCLCYTGMIDEGPQLVLSAGLQSWGLYVAGASSELFLNTRPKF